MKFLLGHKKGMTQVFVDDKAVPVTAVSIPENAVCKIDEKEGRKVVRLGIGEKKKPTKPELGKYKKYGKVPQSVITFEINDEEKYKVGDKVKIGDVLKEGDLLKVTGTTKSKGFAGVVKRWGFKGGPRTHGQSDRLRAPGSIGGGTDPGRVLPGKKMPGRMGGITKTLRKRKVIDVGDDYILIAGPLPGNNGQLLKIEVEESNEA